MKKIVMMVMASLFLVGVASTANAVVLFPAGANGVPNNVSQYNYGTLLNSVSYNYTLLGSTVLGTISEEVYKNDTGLLFVYDFDRNAVVSDSSRNSISSLSVYNYSGFSVDAMNNGDTTGMSPYMGIRSSDSNLQFLYSSIVVGTETKSLLLQTTAQYYTTGGFSLQGGPTDSFSGFAPTATPEPATASLLGMGLLGLLRFRRKTTV